MEKHCNICNTTKPSSEFHIRAASADGLAARCKNCQREYDKARAMLPHRVLARLEYQKTPAGMESVARAKKKYDRSHKKGIVTTKWRSRNSAAYAAHVIVGNAIRDGKLEKKECEKCGRKAQAHHDDYTKPLDVVWLCPKHHKQRHKEMAIAGIEP